VSLVYPGNQTSQACLRPTVAAMERVLGLTPAQRRRTVLRLDGGFGTDANLNWALWQGYQVLAKGYSGKRANAFARAVPQWEELRTGERWIAPAPLPLRYDRRTQTAVLKWKTEQGRYGYSLLTTSLVEHSLAALAEAYDERAAIEAEIKADKGGLQLHRRRKRRLAAQEALVLLTDLAHNLLAWTRGWMFRDSPFADAGIYRIVKELLPIPGKVTVQGGQLVKLRLKESHPLARPMLACLTRLFDQFGTPGILRKS
jgi:Transposase DDE domain group 1